MKRKPTKYPNVRFVIREWFAEIRGLNIGNPGTLKEINRIKRAALAELQGK